MLVESHYCLEMLEESCYEEQEMMVDQQMNHFGPFLFPVNHPWW